MENNSVVVKNTRRIMAEKGLKQKFVAEKVGITSKQFSNLLNGRRVINANDVWKLSLALNVTPNELFGI